MLARGNRETVARRQRDLEIREQENKAARNAGRVQESPHRLHGLETARRYSRHHLANQTRRVVPALRRRNEQVHPLSKQSQADAVSGKESGEHQERGEFYDQIILGSTDASKSQ